MNTTTPRIRLLMAQVDDALQRCGLTLDDDTRARAEEAVIELAARKPKDSPRTNNNISGEVAGRIIANTL